MNKGNIYGLYCVVAAVVAISVTFQKSKMSGHP